MGLPVSLGVALKEWAVVCGALGAGRQIMLLRKGGIHDVGGVFELEESAFLMFPTYVHQKGEMLKAGFREGLEVGAAEPETVTLSVAAEVTDVVRVSSRAQVDALEGEHVWAPAYVDMRFNYKPSNPLYLILLRAYRLREAVVVGNTPAYLGCKSWVELEREVGVGGAEAVLDDGAYAVRRAGVLEKVGEGKT